MHFSFQYPRQNSGLLSEVLIPSAIHFQGNAWTAVSTTISKQEELILHSAQLMPCNYEGLNRRDLECLWHYRPELAMTICDCLACKGYRSIQSLDQLGYLGDMRGNSTEIFFQPFQQGAIVSSSGRGRDVQSLTLSIQHFRCRPQHCPPSKVPWRMVLKRLSWCGTSPNNASKKCDGDKIDWGYVFGDGPWWLFRWR